MRGDQSHTRTHRIAPHRTPTQAKPSQSAYVCVASKHPEPSLADATIPFPEPWYKKPRPAVAQQHEHGAAEGQGQTQGPRQQRSRGRGCRRARLPHDCNRRDNRQRHGRQQHGRSSTRGRGSGPDACLQLGDCPVVTSEHGDCPAHTTRRPVWLTRSLRCAANLYAKDHRTVDPAAADADGRRLCPRELGTLEKCDAGERPHSGEEVGETV